MSKLNQEEIEKMALNRRPQGSAATIGSYDRSTYEIRRESFVEGFQSCQGLDEESDANILKSFIDEIKKESKNQNWDYLEFIAERILTK